MFWKFLNLQKLLDSLFDDSWFDLGLPQDAVRMQLPLADLL